ncbi:MAG: rRNA pseudouridine synthase [Chlorobi bacterium]|nr:rRNA pseudouridine synthase [Chlorobiota bacterium]
MKSSIVSLPRALSKLGYCSRSRAVELIVGGHVTVGGRRVTDPTARVDIRRDAIAVDGTPLQHPREHLYVMLNKPRGYVVSRRSQRGEPTVFELVELSRSHHLVPVGRLDKASEGMLLLTTDTAWADRLTRPDRHVPKVYHVQIRGKLDAELVARLCIGIADGGELLRATSAAVLREGKRNQWLVITLTEGRNRQLRRMIAALGADVLRLVRVQIGALALGDLGKGQWRLLSPDERELAARAEVV